MKPYLFYSRNYKPDKEHYKLHYKMIYKDHQKILDVGCSTGNFLMHCSKGSWGIDADEESIKVAESRGLNVRVCDLDHDTISFPDNHFDCINCISTLEHLRNPVKALIEMKRVLKPGGQLVIRSKNLLWFKFRYWNNYNNYSMITPGSISQFLKVAGFEDFLIYYIKRKMLGSGLMYKIGIKPEWIFTLMLFWATFSRQYVFVLVDKEK